MLEVVMLDDRVFEIASVDPEHPLTEVRAKGLAEALRRQDMFDEIKVEPRGEWPGEARTSDDGERSRSFPGLLARYTVNIASEPQNFLRLVIAIRLPLR